MKNIISYFLIAILAFSVISCKSREEKALETIREEMNKTLDDFSWQKYLYYVDHFYSEAEERNE